VAAFRSLARRIARVSLVQLSDVDKRDPVLFLRSFFDDQVELGRSRKPLWHSIMSIGESAPLLDHILLEEATPVGPVVAIGAPGSPPPFGAARLYTKDSEWQQEMSRLSRLAKAIVIVLDETEGVLWELSHIRSSGHTAKTLFLLPPRLAWSDLVVEIMRGYF